MKREEITVVRIRQFLLAIIKIVANIKSYYELVTFLMTYGHNIVIPFRTYVIGLYSYISRSLNVQLKLEIILYHYRFIKDSFKTSALEQIFKDGIECWSERILCDDNKVVLTTSKVLEFEGSFSLYYKLNSAIIYTMSFTFAPGSCFNIAEDTIIFISNSQGVFGQSENISKATKLNTDITPAVILMNIMEGIAISLNIKRAVGIQVKNQLSFSTSSDYKKFYSNYDEFWEIFGGEKKVCEDYLLSYPLHHKPIHLIKQKYRNRTLAKRNRVSIISNHCSNTFSQFLNNS